MKILIRALARSRDCKWQVQIDQQAVNFRSEAEARAFVDKLQSRLHAPHRLPERLAGCVRPTALRRSARCTNAGSPLPGPRPEARTG